MGWAVAVFLLASAAFATSATAEPTVTEFTGGVTPGFGANRTPLGITVGADGNIWFTERIGYLARVNPNGTVSEFPLTSEGHPDTAIAGDRSGNIWYTLPSDSPPRVGRLSPGGTFTEYTPGTTPGFNANSGFLKDITVDRFGYPWFTDSAGRLGRVNFDGTVTELEAGGSTTGFDAGVKPYAITTGPDGNIWFSDANYPHTGIARLNTNVSVTEFKAGTTPGITPDFNEGLTSGPDGNIWYSKDGSNGQPGGLGRLNPDGTATEFTPKVTPGFHPGTFDEGITVGCDASIWFTDIGGGVGRLNPNGTVTEYLDQYLPGATPGLSSYPYRLTSGPDGNIWFTEPGDTSHPGDPGRIGRLTPPPGAETRPASGVGQRFATLSGTVRPCGQPTVYSFEYGTSTAYGNATAPVGVPGVLSPVPQSAPLSGLRPNTLYHYRLDATNHSGTTNGADRTFTTPPRPTISVLGAFPAVFAAQSSGPSARITRKRHRGTTVRFRLNEAAKVRFTITKQAPGRKIKKGKKRVCVKPTHKNSKHKRCKRRVTLKGSFTINGVKGKNHFHFTGRLNGKKLPPGKYRLVATPTTGGVKGKSVSTAIRIVR